MIAGSTATPGHDKDSPVEVGIFENETRTGAKRLKGCRQTTGKRCLDASRWGNGG